MKVELMKAKTAVDFLDIRDKLVNGEIVSVATSETNPIELYKLLKFSRLDFCNCFVPNNEKAVFCVMSDKKFVEFVNLYNNLKINKNCVCKYSDVEKFVEFAGACGLNVMGGAFLDEGQVLYID